MKQIRKYCNKTVLFLIIPIFSGLLSCNETDEADVLFTGDEYKNIMQYIDGDPNFTSFKSIVLAGKMTDVLSSYNSNGGIDYTIFLPTNDAVAKFIQENESYSTLDDLLLDQTYCAEIVRYHLVNDRISSNEFPNGALNSKTISNYFLTIFFREENEDISFAVNDEAKVLLTDIVLNNGTIHIIDKMLTPVVFTSFEWIERNANFSIFAELLEKCGLADTLNAFSLDELGREIYNEYTLFAESDMLYQSKGISSFGDLVEYIDPSGSNNQDYTSSDNIVNKYARYHILERSVFLDEFSTAIYDTYGDFPVSVLLDDSLKFNIGTEVFDSIITNEDTIAVNYLQINLNNSNIVTRSGAIHQLNNLLFPYLPGRQTETYQFYEEPVINALRTLEGNFRIPDTELEHIGLIGTSVLEYIKSPSDIRNCANNDYIQVSGDLELTFETPRILAGRYEVRLIVQRGFNYLATFQTLIDDKKVGVIVDATKRIGNQPTGFNNNDNGSVVGNVEFTDFSSHTIKIKTVIPGRVLIDRIILRPI